MPKSQAYLHELQDSETHDGNSYQSCYAEINIDNKVNRDYSIFNKSYSVVMGARKYTSDDATEFVGYPENKFTWEFGEPTYDPMTVVDIADFTEDDVTEQALNDIPDGA